MGIRITDYHYIGKTPPWALPWYQRWYVVGGLVCASAAVMYAWWTWGHLLKFHQ